MKSIIARVQRDQKVIVCHYVWMGNHAHIIILSRDSEQCCRFYGEIQKQLTEAIKKLLGLPHLNLWKKNSASLVLYGDVESLMTRIAYLYANPARAHLVDKITQYPGLSSIRGFKKSPNTIEAKYTELVSWIRNPYIPRISIPTPNFTQDIALANKLNKHAKRSHLLVLQPNAWMKSFGLDDEVVEDINEHIMARIEKFESNARADRIRRGFRPMGAKRLEAQPIDLAYMSKSQGRRIFVYASDKNIRMRMIQRYKEFCRICDECYQRWKLGDYTIEWPPGAFKPPIPPQVNCFRCDPV